MNPATPTASPKPLNLADIRTTTALLYSVGRCMLSAGAFCATRACAKLGFQPFEHSSAYWCLSLALSMRTALKDPNCRYVVTADGDTIYDWRHVAHLWTLMETYPQADAIAALQCKRDSAALLMNPAKNGASPTDELVPVTLAHFGLTIFRVEALRAVTQPWFQRLPDPDQPGDTIDEDVYFWRRWVELGRTAFVATRCPVGHLDEFVMWPGENGRPLIQPWSNFNETGLTPNGTRASSWELAEQQKRQPKSITGLTVVTPDGEERTRAIEELSVKA